MLQLALRKNSRIFILVFAAVIAFSGVSKCSYLEEELRSNNFDGNLKTEDEAGVTDDQDADVFIAEIFPVGVGNFEQIFHPLARYRKATLGLDAEIEPMRGSQIQEHKQSRPDVPVVDRTRTQSKALPESSFVDANHGFSTVNPLHLSATREMKISPLAGNISKSSSQDGLDYTISNNYNKFDSDALHLFRKRPQQSEIPLGKGRQVVKHYLSSTDEEEDEINGSSGSGVEEGSGTQETNTTKDNSLRDNKHKTIKMDYGRQKHENELLYIQQGNLTLQKNNESKKEDKLIKKWSKNGYVLFGDNISNGSRSDSLEKAPANSAHDEIDKVYNNATSLVNSKVGNKWENGEMKYTNASEYRKNAKYTSHYESSDMTVDHKLENKTLFAPVGSRLKQPVGANEQPVNTKNGLREQNKEGAYLDEGSGDGSSMNDEESGSEPSDKEGLEYSVGNRDKQILHHGTTRSGSSNANVEAGGGNTVRNENASKAVGETPCVNQTANCNSVVPLVNRNDWIPQKVAIMPQTNEPVENGWSASENLTGISRFQEDVAYEGFKAIHDNNLLYNGEKNSGKETDRGKESYASNETKSAAAARNSNLVNMAKEDVRNVSNNERDQDEHAVKINSTKINGTVADQSEQMLKNNDIRTDLKKSSTNKVAWTEKNDDNEINSGVGKISEDMRINPISNSPDNEKTRFSLSRGEAVRQLFLSSLSRKEGEDQKSEENLTKNRVHAPDKNRESHVQETKAGSYMPNHVSENKNLHLQTANRFMASDKGHSNSMTTEVGKDLARKKLKEATKLRHGEEGLLLRHISLDKHRKHKNFHKSNKSKIHHKSKYVEENPKAITEVGKSNENFITKMMSVKARELYKNLIHDTSKALMSRKLHQNKRSKHHFARMKSSQSDDNKDIRNKVKGTDSQQRHYFRHVEGTLNAHQSSSTRFPEMQTLTTRLLNTMTENSHHLVEQTKFSPLRASQKVEIKNSMRERLDSPHSLVEKLAELRYAKNDRMKEEEVPIPESENAEDTSSTGPEVDKENPGKTVLQRQSKVGLGADINMDSLDGRKQEYEFKSLDATIEGELARDQMMNENNKELSIGQINANQNNKDYRNITESAMKAAPIPSSLNVYNTEEVLGSETELYRYGNNSNTTERMHGYKKGSERKVNQTMDLHGNTSNQELDMGHTTPSDFIRKKVKNKHLQRRPTMYFSGNSSLWKHHPFVSMDIRPLVDVFYKVNHKNLIDLVREDEKEGGKGKTRNNSHHSVQRKKPRRKKIMQGKALEHHKSSKRKQLKKRKRKLKKLGLYMRKIQANKNRKATFNERKGKYINDLMNLFHNITSKSKDSKAHFKKDNKKLQEKYKQKKKIHVKATVKFGISEMEQRANPPEIPEIKNNMPDQVQYYKIENAAKYGAVCIDGSVPGYYFRKGKGQDINKWIIHLHGGAWCYDPETCFRRSFSILGSTNNWSAENITNFFQGILSSSKDVNPWLSDWNIVVQSYCDGGLFSGRRKEPFLYRGRKLYFRGRQILKAMVESLKRRNLQKASDILLSGTSAGGLAILLQGDYIRHKLPKTASVRGLVDAGYFLDSQAEDGSQIVGNQFQGLYELHRPKLTKGCERRWDNGTRYLCLFPQYSVERIKLPIYFVNALYDHWQLSELQKVRCVYHNDQCMTAERDRILNFRTDMYSRLKDAITHLPKAGLFANSCIGHGQAIVDYTWSRIHVNNSSLREAFNDWLRDTHFEKKHLNVDCHFPCNGSCPKAMVNSCIKNFKGASSNHRTRRNAELC